MATSTLGNRIAVTRASSLAGVAAAALVSCGPEPGDDIPDDAAERYAKAICSAYDRCGCSGVVYREQDECLAGAAALFEAIAETPGLEFSLDCFDRFLAYGEDVGCGENSTATHPGCVVFAGSIPAGEACTSEAVLYTRWSSENVNGYLAMGACESDLQCIDGRCGGDPPPLPIGSPCSLSSGAGCVSQMQGRRAYCAPDGICRETSDRGGACDSPAACEDLLEDHCTNVVSGELDITGECAPRLALGDACELVAVDACPLGAHCGSSGTCEEPWPAVCAALAWPPGVSDPFDWTPVE